MTFDEVLSKFRIERRSQDGAQCICPAHRDEKASLTISKGEKRTLLYCHAGCDTEKILGAVGLKMSDLFEEPYWRSNERWREYVENREQRQIEDVYNYVDLSGRYAYTRLRLTGKNFVMELLRMTGSFMDFGEHPGRTSQLSIVMGSTNLKGRSQTENVFFMLRARKM